MKSTRIVPLLLSLLVMLLLLVACGEEDPPPAPNEEPAPAAQTPTAEADPVDAPAEPEAEPADEPAEAVEDPIYLAIIWHQHQPVYFKDPETGVYVRPWVRAHATKDYVDMAAMLEDYPDIHATFNLTPSLIRQLDDLAAGAKDIYQVYAEIPADELTDEQKQFILDRFFDTNRGIVARFPRYQELLDLRDGSDDPLSAYTTDDFRDLQVLFNLAWVDPDWLAEEPLAGLVAKGSGFDEADKEILFAEHLRLIQEVIPVHKALQDAGQIEVTMTPFAHPILPLLVNTDLARVALPDIELPSQRFAYGQDAVAQVEQGVQLYEEHFGQPVRGMWPAEGSVAQEIVTMVSRSGVQWMASDEGVLANSLGMDSFTRDGREVVNEADQLYRPYYVQGQSGDPVAMVFRDVVISDKVGFTYSGLPGDAAAQDFVDRVHLIRDELQADGAEGPHLVSVILDGENAWEYYENDGKEFLHTLYTLLSDDPTIQTVTPSEFLEMTPDQPDIEELWAGSWINHDYSTWIGEEEENRAWEYLTETRSFLQPFITGQRQDEVTPEQLERALEQMYIAEGSDWFWWYGADQNSGNDSAFDEQYRSTLRQVYVELGQEVPDFVDVPIIPQAAATAVRDATDLISPTIDGVVDEGEWDTAGEYAAEGGVMAAGQATFDALGYGFDAQNMYLDLALAADHSYPAGASSMEVYVSVPGGSDASNFSAGGSLLGFPANRRLTIRFEDGTPVDAAVAAFEGGEWVPLTTAAASANLLTLTYGEDDEGAPITGDVAVGENDIEAAIPLSALGSVDVGARVSLRAFAQATVAEELVDVDQVPASGPAVVAVPDLGTTVVIIDIADPEGDDTGPGTYTYPTEGIFNPGNFDITNFQVGTDDNNIVFRFTIRGPLDNVWDSPNGVSVQTFDVYVDKDGAAAGGDMLLPGRNLALADEYRWEYAITVEGWTSGIFVPGADGPEQVASASEFSVLADPGQRKVTVRVPKSILGDDPENWQFAAVIMGQEGFPSGGVMRVRDVNVENEQWRFGGAPEGTTNHTRVIDFVWPEAGQQEAWLSEFAPSDAPQADLTVSDVALVPLFGAE